MFYNINYKTKSLGRGGGQVVSVLAFYSVDPCSNPANAYNFSPRFVFEKTENKRKEFGVGYNYLIVFISVSICIHVCLSFCLFPSLLILFSVLLSWSTSLGIFLCLQPVWPDLAIYWTLGKFLKPLAAINLPKSPTFLGNFLKVSKSVILLVKSFLANFYGHLVIFLWSHCLQPSLRQSLSIPLNPSTFLSLTVTSAFVSDPSGTFFYAFANNHSSIKKSILFTHTLWSVSTRTPSLTRSVTGKKSPKEYEKLPKIDFTRKIAITCLWFGHNICCHRLWKVTQSEINRPIWSHCSHAWRHEHVQRARNGVPPLERVSSQFNIPSPFDSPARGRTRVS